MSQAEELLTSLAQHTHPVSDSDEYFVIDPTTRNIERSTRYSNVLMQYDHNSERYTFKLPRYIDGHDMSKCTSVVVNFDNIEAETGKINSGPHDMDDLRINPDDTETVISSWLIARDSTQLAGILSFSIEYKCVDDEGNVVYEWGTNTYDEVEVKPRKKNSEAAISEHVDILEQWRTKIFGAGDSVVTNINDAAEIQLSAISEEAAIQKVDIEAKGAETLATIPVEYTELYNLANSAERTKSNAIICEAEGVALSVTDASNDYIRGLNVYGKTTQVVTTGKNLFNKDVDNIILIDKMEYPHYGYELKLPAGIYTVSCANSYSAYIYASVYNGTAVGETVYVVLPTELRTGTFTLSDDDTLYIYNAVNVNYGLGGESTTKSIFNACQIQVEPGDKATSYEPYSNGIQSPSPEYPQELMSVDTPITNVCGKNILNNQAIDKTASGITFTVNADKSVTINGTSTSSAFLDLDMTSMISRSGTELTASLGGNGDVVMNVGYFDADGLVNDCVVEVTADERTFVYPVNAVRMRVYMFVGSDKTFDNVTVYPMIRITSKTDNSYEPYTGSSITIARTLSGIPVTSGGNYTDSDGQQWICDEIDLERGVYVQRINTLIFDSSNVGNWWEYFSPGYEGYARTVPDMLQGVRWAGYCDRFQVHTTGSTDMGIWMGAGNDVLYIHNAIDLFPSLEYFKEWVSANPVTVMYPIETPIEKPLTAEEITAFKGLRTNYPNTTILNDAGVWMSVKYNADTKTYIENPKILKLTDSSTGVVYELKIIDSNLTVTPV